MSPRISDSVKQDYREIQACYTRIINSATRDEQVRFQNLFTWEMARNLVGEELVVYPALEKHVQGGASLAEKDRQEHHRIKEELKAFQSMDPTNAGYIPTLTVLMEDFSRQSKREENNELVMLEEALSAHDSESLSRSFTRTKIFVPSRAHPGAPSKPPFETAVGLLTAPFDQVADLFRKWPQKSQMED